MTEHQTGVNGVCSVRGKVLLATSPVEYGRSSRRVSYTERLRSPERQTLTLILLGNRRSLEALSPARPNVEVLRDRPSHSELRCGGSAETVRSEEHTSELQSLMRISYAVFCLKKNNKSK